jgi:sugar lactone lactonase YvrE
MNKIQTILAVALTCGLPAHAQELVKLWETPAALFTPESALFSAGDKVLYVSNIGQGTNSWAMDGNGSIGKVGLDGKIIAAEWTKGLDAPKGLGLRGGKLYAADVNRVVVIDVARGEIEKTITIEGAQGLNDITVDAAGVVYVSDFKAGRIYAITEGKPALILDALKTPNGVLARGKVLYVLDSGMLSVTDDGPGKTLRKIVDGLEGGTDGIEHIRGDEFIVSCWRGVLYHVNVATKQKHILLDTRAANVHSADIGYDAAKRVIYVPTFYENTVVAYQMK